MSATDERPETLNTADDPTSLAKQLVKLSLSSYRRDVGIGCVDVENLTENISMMIAALQSQNESIRSQVIEECAAKAETHLASLGYTADRAFYGTQAAEEIARAIRSQHRNKEGK